jgi:hypothetical protein
MALSEAFLREVGRITVNFATLELYLSFAISGLLGPDQAIGQIVTAELSFKNKLALFSSLFRHKVQVSAKNSHGALPDLESLLARLSKCEEARNQVAHSVWLVADDALREEVSRLKITSKQRRGLQHVTEPTTASQLRVIADEIRATSESIMPLLFRYFENAQTS